MALVVKTRIPSSDDIRRFCINSDTTFSSLMATLKMLYPTMSQITVKYQVNESTTVEITSETEFREAVSAAHKSRPPILRLVLEQQSPNLLDSTWIVVPEESQPPVIPEATKPMETQPVATPSTNPATKLFSFSSLPSIFGFQLPSFSGGGGGGSGSLGTSPSPSNSSSKLADEIKEASEKARVESTQMDIEPEINIDLTSAPSEQLIFELQEDMDTPGEPLEPAVLTPTPVSQQAQPAVSENSPSTEGPIPKRLRTVDVCAQLSEETKASCILNSNQTLSDSIPLWKNTLIDCSDYSRATLASCARESASILSQISSSPKAIAGECVQLSEETTKVCGKISSDIAAMTVTLGASPVLRSSAELSVIQNCEDLSKATANDCRTLSRNLVAELLAL